MFQVCDYYFLPQLGTRTLQDLATQMCVVNEKRKQHRCLENPLIVLCSTPFHAQELLAIAQGIDGDAAIEVISQPCGPRKFAKTLEVCTEHSAQPRRSDSSSSDQLASEPISTPEPDSMIQMNLGPENRDHSYMALRPKHKADGNESESLEVDPSAVEDEGEYPTSAEATPRAEKANNGFCTPKVMIVDDNHINQKLLAAYMRKCKWVYTTAANGLEALQAFHPEPGAFKVIFMGIFSFLSFACVSAYPI